MLMIVTLKRHEIQREIKYYLIQLHNSGLIEMTINTKNERYMKMGYKESLKNFVYESKKLSDNIIENRKKRGKKMELSDGAIIGLYEQIVQKSEDLYYLIENERFASGSIILRVIFEEYVYLRYILKKRAHVNELAESYFRYTRLQEKEIYNAIIADNETGEKIRDTLEFNDIHSAKSSLDSNFRNNNFRTFEDFYDNLSNKYKKIRPDIVTRRGNNKERIWYNYNGKINNLRELCKELDIENLYVLVYKVFSANTHGNRVIESIEIDGNSGYFKPIKITDDKMIASMISKILWDLNADIYNYYDMHTALKNYKGTVSFKYLVDSKKF